MIPVDHEMAVKKGWGRIPLTKLEKRLDEKTKGRVLRLDKPVPAALADKVTAHDAVLRNINRAVTPPSDRHAQPATPARMLRTDRMLHMSAVHSGT